jgi:sigma-B regulation protein RsbU (phosphoserine phosphatase)
MMSSVRAALRAFARGVYDLTEIMSLVNRHMQRETKIGEFATMFYGVFSPDGRQLTYCNAGHDPPLLLRGDTIVKLETGGTVIGVVKDAVYQQEVLHLEQGDSLLFYTDGAIDAMNYDGETYGRKRLVESLIRYRALDAVSLTHQIVWDIRRFAGLATQSDDITVVVAKVL